MLYIFKISLPLLLLVIIACSDFPEIPYEERTGGLSNSKKTGCNTSASNAWIAEKIDAYIAEGENIVYGEDFTDGRWDVDNFLNQEIYKTIVIGNQIWMAKNMNYKVQGFDTKCYEDKASNCTKYGVLYDWESAMAACPSNRGWHLPSKADWDLLLNNIGGLLEAGEKLKAKSGWNVNGNGLDTYGFAALPGGLCEPDGYSLEGYFGAWWTSTTSEEGKAYGMFMLYGNTVIDGTSVSGNEVRQISENKQAMYLSVRCIKDQ